MPPPHKKMSSLHCLSFIELDKVQFGSPDSNVVVNGRGTCDVHNNCIEMLCNEYTGDVYQILIFNLVVVGVSSKNLLSTTT